MAYPYILAAGQLVDWMSNNPLLSATVSLSLGAVIMAPILHKYNHVPETISAPSPIPGPNTPSLLFFSHLNSTNFTGGVKYNETAIVKVDNNNATTVPVIEQIRVVYECTSARLVPVPCELPEPEPEPEPYSASSYNTIHYWVYTVLLLLIAYLLRAFFITKRTARKARRTARKAHRTFRTPHRNLVTGRPTSEHVLEELNTRHSPELWSYYTAWAAEVDKVGVLQKAAEKHVAERLVLVERYQNRIDVVEHKITDLRRAHKEEIDKRMKDEAKRTNSYLETITRQEMELNKLRRAEKALEDLRTQKLLAAEQYEKVISDMEQNREQALEKKLEAAEQKIDDKKIEIEADLKELFGGPIEDEGSSEMPNTDDNDTHTQEDTSGEPKVGKKEHPQSDTPLNPSVAAFVPPQTPVVSQTPAAPSPLVSQQTSANSSNTGSARWKPTRRRGVDGHTAKLKRRAALAQRGDDV